MRGLVLLLTVTVASLLGMALGLVLYRHGNATSGTPGARFEPAPPLHTPVVGLGDLPPPPSASGTNAPAVREAQDLVGPGSTAAAIRKWRREDKDEIVRLVEKLPRSDVDFLCLTLGLIPSEEVFDKVNVKGRLIRYIDGLNRPAEFADLKAAFEQLDRERSRNDRLPRN